MPVKLNSYEAFADSLDSIYKNPKLTSDSLVQKVDERGDLLEEESSYDNNLVFPTNYRLEKRKQEEQLKKSSADETMYGYQPPSWTPEWVKAGYSRSITGITERMIKGEAIKEDYDLNIVEDVGATLISFLQPLDWATMIAGGGVGGLAAKQALKTGAKEAIKKGLTKKASKTFIANKLDDKAAMAVLGNAPNNAIRLMTESGINARVASKAVKNAAPRVVHKALIEGVKGAGGLGFYSGLATAAYDKTSTGDVDEVMALKETLKGGTLGLVTSGTGSILKSVLSPKLSNVTRTTAIKAAETAEFGVLAPTLSGEEINLEGFIHAAGTIGGLTAQKAAMSGIKKGIKKIKSKRFDSAMDAQTTAEYIMSEKLPDKKVSARNIIESQEIFIDRYDNQYNNLKFNDKAKQVTLINKKTKEPLELNYDQFDQLLITREGNRSKTPKGLALGRNQKIKNLKRKLKLSDKEFQSHIESAKLEKTVEFQKDPLNLKTLQPIEQLKLLNEMRHQGRVVELKNSFIKNGWEGDLLPKKMLMDEIAPTLPKFWRQSKNRISTQLGKMSLVDFNNADALNLTTLGRFLQEFNHIGAFKNGLFKSKKLRRYYEGIADKMEDPRYGKNGDASLPDYNRIQEYRKVMDNMWNRATKSGIDLGPKEDFYFPHMIKPEFLKVFNRDIALIGKENPSLVFDKATNSKEFQSLILDHIQNNKFNESTVSALKEMAGIKETNVSKSRAQMAAENKKIAQAFYDLNSAVTVHFSSTAKNLELARQGTKIPKAFMERDSRLVLARYATQLAKRISFVETFGTQGEKISGRIAALRTNAAQKTKLGDIATGKQLDTEANTIDMLFKSYTNKIEMDPSYNWKPTAKKFWSEVVNFEIGTKIGLGFATIPNLTQLSISTAVKAGYYPMMKGMIKMSMPTKAGKEYRAEIAKAGVSNLSIFQMINSLEPTDTFMGRFADVTTRAFGFQTINKFNQLASAAAAREWITGLQKAATGKSALLDVGLKLPKVLGGDKVNRRNWAIKNLQDLGITDYTKKIPPKKMYEGMYKFARDSQLQRNVLNEPLVSLDPRFRPFFLFKKFGYKQFNWMREQLQAEVSRGNLFPLLRLGVAGMAGGEMVSWARDALAQKFAGQPVYDENRYMFSFLNEGTPMASTGSDSFIDMSKFTIDDYIDKFAAVGAFGVIGDIVSNENKVRALEFAFKPAVVQDFDKIWSAMTRTMQDTKDYGLGAAKRFPKYIAPLLGTAPRRFLERYEPSGQRQAYVKRRKQIILPKIKDAIIDGDSQRATKLIKSYNNSFGRENPILWEDYDSDAIGERIINKAKKKANP